jgi:hypothetical protein
MEDFDSTDPSIALKVFAEAKRRGIDVRALTPAQYTEIALSVRTIKQAVVDAATAAESVVATTLGYRKLSLEQINARKSTCESNKCGGFGRLAGGQPVCHLCSCNSKFLEAKWKDPRQACPRGLWEGDQ